MPGMRLVCALLLFTLSACAHQHAAAPPAAPVPAAAVPAAAAPSMDAAVPTQPEPAVTPAPPAMPVAPAASSAAVSTAQSAAPVITARPSAQTVPPRATVAPQTNKPPSAAVAPLAHASAPAPAPAAAPATASPSLDLASLEQRLRDTRAIGVFTKLSIKNQVDDLLAQFKGFHGGRPKPTLAELREKYELLLLKVVSVLQDGDAQLASAVSSSREAIWTVLADPQKFAQIQS